MQIRLEVAHKSANIKKVEIRSDTLIGRGEDCNLRILSNEISRKHCRITMKESNVFIRDLASANGTYLDGVRIPADRDVPLAPDAQLRIGRFDFVIRFDDVTGPVADRNDLPPDINDSPEAGSLSENLPVATPEVEEDELEDSLKIGTLTTEDHEDGDASLDTAQISMAGTEFESPDPEDDEEDDESDEFLDSDDEEMELDLVDSDEEKAEENDSEWDSDPELEYEDEEYEEDEEEEAEYDEDYTGEWSDDDEE